MPINTTSGEYKIDLSNGLSISSYTTPNEIKTWTLNDVETDKYPTALALIGTLLRLTLADNSTITTDLAALDDVYPTSLTFNTTSRLLTLGLSNSTSLTATISDVILQTATLNSTSKVLTLTNSNASTATVDLTPIADNSVMSAAYNKVNETLTLVKKDNTTVNVALSNTRNKYYSIGSVLDLTGVFDATYSTASYTIPSNQGNVSMLLNLAATTVPTTLYLPRIDDVDIGWECTVLTYDTTGLVPSKALAESTGGYVIYNDLTDPLASTSPYSNLTNTVNLEVGHFYRIKKISSKFYLIHYN